MGFAGTGRKKVTPVKRSVVAEEEVLGPLDRRSNMASGATRGWFRTVCLSISMVHVGDPGTSDA